MVKDGDVVIVPAGAEHNIINSSDSEDLKLYTLYSPAHHKRWDRPGDKRRSGKNSPEFDGVTTE